MMVAVLLFSNGETGGSIIMVICGAAVFCTLLAPLLTTSPSGKQFKEVLSPASDSLLNMPAPPQHLPATFPRRVTTRATPPSFSIPSIAKGPVIKSIVAGPREIRRGIIVSQKDTFGFIRPPQGPPDIFFHITELQSNQKYPIGVEVEFTVEHDSSTGRELACQLKLPSGSSSQTMTHTPGATSTPTSPSGNAAPLPASSIPVYFCGTGGIRKSTMVPQKISEKGPEHGRQFGTIISQKDTFGFIRPPQGPPDIFFHITELQSDQHYPVGAKVGFDVEQDLTTNRPLAVNLALVSPTSAMTSARDGRTIHHGKPHPGNVSEKTSAGYDRWNRYKDAQYQNDKPAASSSWRVQAKRDEPSFCGDSRWAGTAPRKTTQW